MSAVATVVPFRRAETGRPADPLGIVGTLINTIYRVDELVGEGGFGVVYRAWHLGLDQPIALKFVRPDAPLATRNRMIRLLYLEAQILHELSRATAGVVQALDASAVALPNGEWAHYVAMEWLAGRTLSEELTARRHSGERQRTVASAIAWLAPALEAVSTAHDLGIAHRDLKPSNLMLTTVRGRSTLKVLDFGIAKIATPADSFGRFDTVRMLTPAYAAPEQIDPRLAATGPWTDVYALALILVELITSAPAYKGQTLCDIQIEAMDRKRRPVPHLNHPIRHVLEKALAVSPSDRYANARELLAALRSLSSKLPAKRRRWPWLGIGSALAIAGLLVTGSITSDSERTQAPKTTTPINDGTDPRRPVLPHVDPAPHGAHEFSKLCWSHIREGRWGWAKSECDEAMKFDPVLPPVRAEVLHGLGLIARQAGEIKEARRCLTESLALYENSAARAELAALR
jgi:serine/threonine-protein kinase